MFAKLGWWTVAACLRFVNAGGFIWAPTIGVCCHGEHFGCILFACGCICLQSLVGGLLLLVGGLSTLAFSSVYL